MILYIIILIIAYLIGSINFSIILSKKMAGFDLREKGSGNDCRKKSSINNLSV